MADRALSSVEEVGIYHLMVNGIAHLRAEVSVQNLLPGHSVVVCQYHTFIDYDSLLESVSQQLRARA